MTLPHEAPTAPAERRAGRAGGGLVRGGLALMFWGAAQGVALVPPAWVGAALALLVGLGFLWWYVVRRDYPGERRRRATLRLRAPGGVVAWVPAVLVCAVAFAGATLVLAARVLPLPSSDTFEYFDRMRYGWLPLAVLAVWLAPMMEEFLFRGWMQRTLERRMPAARAIVLTAAAFAAAHFDLFGLPSRFAVGVASGYLAWLSGSIVPSVLLHAAYNGTLLVADRLAGNVGDASLVDAAHTPRTLATAAAVALVSAAALAWSLQRAAARARRAPSRTTPASPATPLRRSDAA